MNPLRHDDFFPTTESTGVKPMKILAHRGMLFDHPENSRRAIGEAFARGYHVETDLRFTRDGQVALIHDETLERLCGSSRRVGELTAAELTALPLKADPHDHVALLEEVVERPAGVGFGFHLKQEEQTPENCRILQRAFREFDLYATSFVFNLSRACCTLFREIDPAIRLSVLVSDARFEPFVYTPEDLSTWEDGLYDALWGAEYAHLYTEAWVREVGRQGKALVVVSHELHRGLGHPKARHGYQEAWPLLARWGVDGICTDHPDELATTLGHGRRHVDL